MKVMFNFPQKRGKNYISHTTEKIFLELNEIKIKKFQELKDNNGYIIDCNIPINNNDDSIAKIKEIDVNAKETLINNYSIWFNNEKDIDEEDDNIMDLYSNSYDDNMPITLILSNKIETEIIIDGDEKEKEDLILFLNNNKKNKNYIVNIDIIFLGLYICKNIIINKWAIKYINIENIIDNNNADWNRTEIENEWKYDLIDYENDINNKIANLLTSANNAKLLYNEILNENNIKTWENKLYKLKNIIFKK
jgi:hypothetical protein